MVRFQVPVYQQSAFFAEHLLQNVVYDFEDGIGFLSTNCFRKCPLEEYRAYCDLISLVVAPLNTKTLKTT